MEPPGHFGPGKIKLFHWSGFSLSPLVPFPSMKMRCKLLLHLGYQDGSFMLTLTYLSYSNYTVSKDLIFFLLCLPRLLSPDTKSG